MGRRDISDHARSLDHVSDRSESTRHGTSRARSADKPDEFLGDASLFRIVRQARPSSSSRQPNPACDSGRRAERDGYRAIHEPRSKRDFDRDARLAESQAQGLHVEDDRFVFPHVCLEVQGRDGTERTVDLELVTKEYHRGHLSGKAGAGFRMFSAGSAGSRGRTSCDPRHIERLVR